MGLTMGPNPRTKPAPHELSFRPPACADATALQFVPDVADMQHTRHEGPSNDQYARPKLTAHPLTW
jgi:hypothetical protein